MRRRTKSTKLSAAAVANTAFCTVLIAKRSGAVFTSSKKLARSGCVPVLGVGPWKKI